MSVYTTTIRWRRRSDEVFTDNRYSRVHTWDFDGGLSVRASSSPEVVPLPFSDPEAIDPEKAFIGDISSCHMLWFLSLAAKKRFRVELYEDAARGIMEKDEAGKPAITKVTLHPKVLFGGPKRPDEKSLAALHHQAHELCFIANSVKTEIVVEAVIL